MYVYTNPDAVATVCKPPSKKLVSMKNAATQNNPKQLVKVIEITKQKIIESK